MKHNKVVWIAWEKHRRTLELCRYLGIEPVIFESDTPRLLNMPWFMLRTFLTVLKSRPDSLVTQNPSIFLALTACLLKNIFDYNLVIDSHNIGLLPEHPVMKKMPFLYRYFQYTADTTIVTNNGLAALVGENGGRPLVLPDRLPEPGDLEKIELNGRINMVFICTFGADEPFMEVIDISGSLPGDVTLYVTGNYRKLGDTSALPDHDNLILTGYIPEDHYWNLIYSSDLVIDLTTRENCLVCGAYEAVAAGTPLILSDTDALRAYFRKGALFTNNTRDDILKTLLRSIEMLDDLGSEVVSLREKIRSEWEIAGSNLLEILGLSVQ